MRLPAALLALALPYAATAAPSVDSRALPVGPRPARPCPRFDLHAAVQFPGTACLQSALRNMDVNDRDVDGDTPLHNAIHVWNPQAIKLLIRAGADIHMPDFHGQTPIMLAWRLGHARLHEFLLALERESERLLEAVDNDDIVAVQASLLRGASLGMRDVRLDTPLHRAAQNGFTEIGRLLVHHGAALEARNYLGETPLLTASLRDQADFMKMLLDAGANANAIDERRHTPLDIAELRADPQILAMLRRKKARHGVAASVEYDFDESGPAESAPSAP